MDPLAEAALPRAAGSVVLFLFLRVFFCEVWGRGCGESPPPSTKLLPERCARLSRVDASELGMPWGRCECAAICSLKLSACVVRLPTAVWRGIPGTRWYCSAVPPLSTEARDEAPHPPPAGGTPLGWDHTDTGAVAVAGRPTEPDCKLSCAPAPPSMLCMELSAASGRSVDWRKKPGVKRARNPFCCCPRAAEGRRRMYKIMKEGMTSHVM